MPQQRPQINPDTPFLQAVPNRLNIPHHIRRGINEEHSRHSIKSPTPLLRSIQQQKVRRAHAHFSQGGLTLLPHHHGAGRMNIRHHDPRQLIRTRDLVREIHREGV